MTLFRRGTPRLTRPPMFAVHDQGEQWRAYEITMLDVGPAATCEDRYSARAMPCVVCRAAIGPDLAVMVIIVEPHPCRDDGAHLKAGAFLRHAACQDAPDDLILANARAMSGARRV